MQNAIEPAKAFLEMIGLISTGVLPIPEWLVYSHVSMITNREALLPLDKVHTEQPKLPLELLSKTRENYSI